ncbi:MAG: hypothetical protein PHW79_10510 [Candidatus Marinimicrobia bacterium]|nr:hypothetical protein [Candidatus Neomarinimicrobiota bacterium]
MRPSTPTKAAVPGKSESVAENQGKTVVVNLNVSEGRQEYVERKLNDILESIGESYSKRMTNELMKRLENTIHEFHDEVTKILDKLETLEGERHKVTEEIAASETEQVATESDVSGMSEIEKRLEMKEREKKESPKSEETEEEPKRRGLFGRKK